MRLRPKLDEKDEWSKHRIHPTIRAYELGIKETQLLICINVDVYVISGMESFDYWRRRLRNRLKVVEPFPPEDTSDPSEISREQVI